MINGGGGKQLKMKLSCCNSFKRCSRDAIGKQLMHCLNFCWAFAQDKSWGSTVYAGLRLVALIFPGGFPLPTVRMSV